MRRAGPGDRLKGLDAAAVNNGQRVSEVSTAVEEEDQDEQAVRIVLKASIARPVTHKPPA